jgi:hypothetical protein
MTPSERFMRHHYGPSGYVQPTKEELAEAICPACGRAGVPDNTLRDLVLRAAELLRGAMGEEGEVEWDKMVNQWLKDAGLDKEK